MWTGKEKGQPLKSGENKERDETLAFDQLQYLATFLTFTVSQHLERFTPTSKSLKDHIKLYFYPSIHWDRQSPHTSVTSLKRS